MKKKVEADQREDLPLRHIVAAIATFEMRESREPR
jgi:hypothetical protein